MPNFEDITSVITSSKNGNGFNELKEIIESVL